MLNQFKELCNNARDLGSVSTLMRFQKYALSLSSKTQQLIRVHTTVLMRFPAVHTKTWEKDRIAYYDVSGTLCTC